MNMEKGEIVVTGASGALGSGVVRALVAGGRRVIAVERDADRARQAFAGVSNCRVLGLQNLRVIDASVMPSVPCANTHLTTVMIAEYMADQLKGT